VSSTIGGDEHVVGLEVAVDDSGRMRGGEAPAGGDVHRDHVAPRAIAELPAAQRPALHVFHREVDLALVLADLVHVHDVRVREPGQRLGLALESRRAFGARGVARAQQLDRELAIELVVASGVDDAHAARAEPTEHRVAPDVLGIGRGLERILARRGDGRARRQHRRVGVRVRGILAATHRRECPPSWTS
jgi:hypothetical protein